MNKANIQSIRHSKICLVMIYFSFPFFCIKSYSQCYNSIYKYTGSKDVKLPAEAAGIPFKMGDIIYSYKYFVPYNKVVKKISITQVKGFKLVRTDNSAPEATAYIDIRHNFYEMIENRDTNMLTYYLPDLKLTDSNKTVGKYSCIVYTYSTATYRIDMYFTKQLKDIIAPGVYYKGFGGVVKIMYTTRKRTFSYELVSFQQTNETLKTFPVVVSSKPVIHPSFITPE